jgi:hypothetical protein
MSPENTNKYELVKMFLIYGSFYGIIPVFISVCVTICPYGQNSAIQAELIPMEFGFGGSYLNYPIYITVKLSNW